MKVKLEPRASGEAARAMFKEYEVPLDADVGLPRNFVQNDGSDWSLGTPSVMIPGWGVHDAWLGIQWTVARAAPAPAIGTPPLGFRLRRHRFRCRR